MKLSVYMMEMTTTTVWKTSQVILNRTVERQLIQCQKLEKGISEKIKIASATKKPQVDWKTFLINDENKEQLTELCLKEWQKDEYASDLYGRKIVFICDGKAHLLTSEDGKSTTASEIASLESNQEETDTRVILYIDYAQRN